MLPEGFPRHGISAALCATAAATLLSPSPAQAVLIIDFIALSSSKTRIQASGSLDISLLPTGSDRTSGANTTSNTGTNSSRLVTGLNDQLRFTYSSTSVSNSGFRYKITGSNNPFTGPNAAFAFATTSTPTNSPPFILRPINGATTLGGQDFWLPSTYTGSAISGFFDVDASLSQIGLLNGRVVYTIGNETIILREVVPTPLPLFGAAAAFACSRRLRRRIQKAQGPQSA